MTETTYDIIIKKLDEISQKIHDAEETNDFSKLYFLSEQLSSLKDNLKQLLYVEIPDMNDSNKFHALYKNNNFRPFSETFLERHYTRQGFWKRLALQYFENEAERLAFINGAEKEFKQTTASFWKLLKLESKSKKQDLEVEDETRA